jgi:hypothetical protein
VVILPPIALVEFALYDVRLMYDFCTEIKKKTMIMIIIICTQIMIVLLIILTIVVNVAQKNSSIGAKQRIPQQQLQK